MIIRRLASVSPVITAARSCGCRAGSLRNCSSTSTSNAPGSASRAGSSSALAVGAPPRSSGELEQRCYSLFHGLNVEVSVETVKRPLVEGSFTCRLGPSIEFVFLSLLSRDDPACVRERVLAVTAQRAKMIRRSPGVNYTKTIPQLLREELTLATPLEKLCNELDLRLRVELKAPARATQTDDHEPSQPTAYTAMEITDAVWSLEVHVHDTWQPDEIVSKSIHTDGYVSDFTLLLRDALAQTLEYVQECQRRVTKIGAAELPLLLSQSESSLAHRHLFGPQRSRHNLKISGGNHEKSGTDMFVTATVTDAVGNCETMCAPLTPVLNHNGFLFSCYHDSPVVTEAQLHGYVEDDALETNESPHAVSAPVLWRALSAVHSVIPALLCTDADEHTAVHWENCWWLGRQRLAQWEAERCGLKERDQLRYNYPMFAAPLLAETDNLETIASFVTRELGVRHLPIVSIANTLRFPSALAVSDTAGRIECCGECFDDTLAVAEMLTSSSLATSSPRRTIGSLTSFTDSTRGNSSDTVAPDTKATRTEQIADATVDVLVPNIAAYLRRCGIRRCEYHVREQRLVYYSADAEAKLQFTQCATLDFCTSLLHSAAEANCWISVPLSPSSTEHTLFNRVVAAMTEGPRIKKPPPYASKILFPIPLGNSQFVSVSCVTALGMRSMRHKVLQAVSRLWRCPPGTSFDAITAHPPCFFDIWAVTRTTLQALRRLHGEHFSYRITCQRREQPSDGDGAKNQKDASAVAVDDAVTWHFSFQTSSSSSAAVADGTENPEGQKAVRVSTETTASGNLFLSTFFNQLQQIKTFGHALEFDQVVGAFLIPVTLDATNILSAKTLVSLLFKGHEVYVASRTGPSRLELQINDTLRVCLWSGVYPGGRVTEVSRNWIAEQYLMTLPEPARRVVEAVWKVQKLLERLQSYYSTSVSLQCTFQVDEGADGGPACLLVKRTLGSHHEVLLETVSGGNRQECLLAMLALLRARVNEYAALSGSETDHNTSLQSLFNGFASTRVSTSVGSADVSSLDQTSHKLSGLKRRLLHSVTTSPNSLRAKEKEAITVSSNHVIVTVYDASEEKLEIVLQKTTEDGHLSDGADGQDAPTVLLSTPCPWNAVPMRVFPAYYELLGTPLESAKEGLADAHAQRFRDLDIRIKRHVGVAPYLEGLTKIRQDADTRWECLLTLPRSVFVDTVRVKPTEVHQPPSDFRIVARATSKRAAVRLALVSLTTWLLPVCQAALPEPKTRHTQDTENSLLLGIPKPSSPATSLRSFSASGKGDAMPSSTQVHHLGSRASRRPPVFLLPTEHHEDGMYNLPGEENTSGASAGVPSVTSRLPSATKPRRATAAGPSKSALSASSRPVPSATPPAPCRHSLLDALVQVCSRELDAVLSGGTVTGPSSDTSKPTVGSAAAGRGTIQLSVSHTMGLSARYSAVTGPRSVSSRVKRKTPPSQSVTVFSEPWAPSHSVWPPLQILGCVASAAQRLIAHASSPTSTSLADVAKDALTSAEASETTRNGDVPFSDNKAFCLYFVDRYLGFPLIDNTSASCTVGSFSLALLLQRSEKNTAGLCVHHLTLSLVEVPGGETTATANTNLRRFTRVLHKSSGASPAAAEEALWDDVAATITRNIGTSTTPRSPSETDSVMMKKITLWAEK